MLNKTMLIGNLGADVEARETKSKVAVANFRIATTERWKDAEGNQQEATEEEKTLAVEHFKNNTVSHRTVEDLLTSLRNR